VDITSTSALHTSGNSLGAAAADFDGSRRVGIAVANDALPGDLFSNIGRFRFRNIGREYGTVLSSKGRAQAGLGIDLRL
jgi:hypothetical protein